METPVLQCSHPCWVMTDLQLTANCWLHFGLCYIVFRRHRGQCFQWYFSCCLHICCCCWSRFTDQLLNNGSLFWLYFLLSTFYWPFRCHNIKDRIWHHYELDDVILSIYCEECVELCVESLLHKHIFVIPCNIKLKLKTVNNVRIFVFIHCN